jgi:deazaflavin-dependent oxidoreductase (nitroreductase family)
MITEADPHRYITPDAFTRRIFNPVISGLTRLGLSIRGSRVLEVRGRTTGQWRAVPVNPLPSDGGRFLVAPRGETQWVRNIRVAGGGRLRKGRKIEEFRVVEVTNDRKPAILRAYLEAWAFEVGKFFDGVTADSSDAEIAAIAPGFPVFEIVAG